MDDFECIKKLTSLHYAMMVVSNWYDNGVGDVTISIPSTLDVWNITSSIHELESMTDDLQYKGIKLNGGQLGLCNLYWERLQELERNGLTIKI
jgi:hypothetical protein